jgi:integrase
LLGPHGTPSSRAEYRRRIAEWIANDRQLPVDRDDLTIVELIAAYKVHIECYYRHADGTSTGEPANIRQALRPLRLLYGSTPASSFSPLCLKAVRESMINRPVGRGLCRTTINKNINRIRQMFKWGAENEKVPATVYHGLTAVSGLKAGRSDAREQEPVKPVLDAVVEATLVHLSPTVRAMVQLQRLTGARPGEICSMRIGEVDRSSDVWVYRPACHKTSHHGYTRTIYLGPKAKVVLGPFMMKIDPAAFVFSPAEAEAERRTSLHENRRTPMMYGNRPDTNCKRKPKRPPGEFYDVGAYRRAIERATQLAFPPPEHLARKRIKRKKAFRWEMQAEWRERLGADNWAELQVWRREHAWNPHQLRHTAATEIRRQFGIEGAQHVLGHATLNITEIYAEKNADVARRIAAAIG